MKPEPVSAECDGDMSYLLTDERWCVSHLFALRWPEGFVCPFCGYRPPGQLPVRQVVCRRCGRMSTVTAGTLLHGSKKELNCWFRAIWWLICNAADATTRDLQRELGFAGYQTAWTWMGKLRSALRELVEERISGMVVVGSGELPGGRRDQCLYHFLVAVESVAGGRLSGAVRMASVDSVEAGAVSGFIRDHVLPGSVVVVPDREPFTPPVEMDCYIYIADDANSNALVLREVLEHFYTWYRRRKYQPFSRHRMQGQLDEFCFTRTVLLCRNKAELFDRVLMGVIGHGPQGGEG